MSLIFAEYVNRLLWHATSGDSSPDSIPSWSIKLTACLAVVAATTLCIASKNLGTRTAVVLTAIKVCFSHSPFRLLSHRYLTDWFSGKKGIFKYEQLNLTSVSFS